MKLKDLFAYVNERFPVINTALFAILFLTVYSVADFFWPRFSPAGLGWREAWGMAAVVSFFFRLRVFDEQKDYALDAVNHPHRVLQSGRVTLGQLRNVSLAGALLELTWSVIMGMPTLVCWLLAVSYSLLMRYEFFVSRYLQERLVLYALTHMLIMPFVIGWVWSAYVPDYSMTAPLVLLAVLSLLGGFSFEIARKIHAPEAERELIDSYSKAMGYATAIVTVLLVLLTSVAVQCYLLITLQAHALPFVVIGLLYLLTLTTYLYSLTKPQEKTLKAAHVLVSLSMLVSYLSVILVVNV